MNNSEQAFIAYYTEFAFYGPAVIGKYMDGNGEVTYYVSGKSEENGWEQTINCNDFELLENGNILIRYYERMI